MKTRVLSYRAGDDARSWLTHHGVAWGTVSPEKVPYSDLLFAASHGLGWSPEDSRQEA